MKRLPEPLFRNCSRAFASLSLKLTLGSRLLNAPAPQDYGPFTPHPAAPTRAPGAKPRDKRGRADPALPLLFYGVTPTIRSWNQVVGFLTDWEGLRTLAV
jgi:hypothetical protein